MTSRIFPKNKELIYVRDHVYKTETNLKPSVKLSVRQGEHGVATLRFRFIYVDKGFIVSTIVLHFRQLGPETTNTDQPSSHVQVAKYTEVVPSEILEDEDPQIRIETDLVHDASDPYARADITLWYGKSDRTVRLSVRPEYFDSHGNRYNIPTDPDEVEVVLCNSRLVNAIKVPPGARQ